MLCSLILSFLYFEVLFYPNKYFGKEAEILAKIEDIEKKSDYYSIVDLDVYEINGKSVDYKFKLNYYGYSDSVDVGNVISFRSVIQDFDSTGDFDFRHFYTSRGFSAVCDATDIMLERTETPPSTYRFKEIRQKITSYASSLSNDYSGTLFGALLLGEKNALDGQLLLDFQRTGITHILALSGMHVAILMGALDRLLYILRIKKTVRIILGCTASFAFMALTGFPLSVVRAGLMLIISSVLYLITGSKDSITSLFISAALIFVVSPYAALDIGLWLSILATFGILMASEHLNREYNEDVGLKKFARAVYISVIFSLFSLCASSAISALSFNGTSFLSIFATLIFSILTELYVYLGIVVVLLCNVLPLGNLLINFASFIGTSVAYFADLPYIYASLESIAVKIAFVALCAVFALFAILDIKKKQRFIAIIALSYIIVSFITIGVNEMSKNDDKFLAYSNSGDRILIRSDGETLMFDSSSHKRSDAYYSNSILADEQVTEIDIYLLANYSAYLPDSLNILLKNYKVGKILLPLPRSDEEEKIAVETFKTVNQYRAEIGFYEDDKVLKFGEYEILVPVRAYMDNSFAFTFKHQNKEIYTYLSSGVLENTLYSDHLLLVSNKIIFGNYGTDYTYDFVIDDFDKKLSLAAIFDERVSFDFSYTGFEVPIIDNQTKVTIYD